MSAPETPGEALARLQPLIGSALDRALALTSEAPDGLREAMAWPLEGGGKRLRPALVALTAEALGAMADDAWAAMAAVELIHTYSLVHDDLPCMDDDDLRRGRPTTHKVFGEASAVLVGDALLTLAFEVLGRHGGASAAASVGTLARAAGAVGMVGGQALDLAAEGQGADFDSVRRIHGAKTGALLAASVELGALAAGAPSQQAARLRAWGAELGLLFQTVDDLLDITGTAADLGKTPGKDQEAAKATVVRVLGLEGAQREVQRHLHVLEQLAVEAGLNPESTLWGVPLWVAERRS